MGLSKLHSHKDANTIQSLYRKIPLIRPRRIFGQRTNLMGLYSGAYIFERKNLSICSLLNLLSFFQYKARISVFLTSRKMWNMFKVYNKDARIRKVNDKVKNKETVDVTLASLFLTLNTFHFFLQCFYCWLWSVNCRLGLLFVVQTLCGCWNQLRQSFHLWRN